MFATGKPTGRAAMPWGMPLPLARSVLTHNGYRARSKEKGAPLLERPSLPIWETHVTF